LSDATRWHDDISSGRQLTRRNRGEHPSYGGQAVVALEGRGRHAIKQLANALKWMPPIPAIHSAKQFDFPGVYIFGEASGRGSKSCHTKYCLLVEPVG